jgi:hypothetical protein
MVNPGEDCFYLVGICFTHLKSGPALKNAQRLIQPVVRFYIRSECLDSIRQNCPPPVIPKGRIVLAAVVSFHDLSTSIPFRRFYR